MVTDYSALLKVIGTRFDSVVEVAKIALAEAPQGKRTSVALACLEADLSQSLAEDLVFSNGCMKDICPVDIEVVPFHGGEYAWENVTVPQLGAIGARRWVLVLEGAGTHPDDWITLYCFLTVLERENRIQLSHLARRIQRTWDVQMSKVRL